MLPTLLALGLAQIGAPIMPAAGQTEPSSGDLQGWLATGIQALDASDLDRAAAAFHRALGLAPDSEPALLGLSETLLRGGESMAALAAARRAAELAPDSPPAALATAVVLARIGAEDEALGELERLRTLDSDEPQGYLLAAMLMRDRGNTAAAIALLEEARSRRLRDARIDEQLGLLLIPDNRLAEAVALADEALAVYGERPGLHLIRGLALAPSPENRAQAIAELERVLALGIAEPGRVQLELGSLLLADGQPQAAIVQLGQAAELMPESPEVFYRLGSAQRAAGDAAGASTSLSRFQELKSAQERIERRELAVGTALNEAQTLATANRLTEALARLSQILAEHPDEPRVHTLRAKVLYSLGRPADAIAAIQLARQLDPTAVEPHFLEGMFLLQQNRPEGAQRALQQAVDLQPGLAEGWELLGGAAAKLGHPAEAVSCFERALALGADGPGLRLGYAAALDSVGRQEESRRQEEIYRQMTQPRP